MAQFQPEGSSLAARFGEPAQTFAELVSATTRLPGQWRHEPIASMLRSTDPAEVTAVTKQLTAVAMSATEGCDQTDPATLERALDAQNLAATRLLAGQAATSQTCACPWTHAVSID